MITPGFCHMMARYNAWQNASLVAAADTLTGDDLDRFRGSFFGSIYATFNHLLWADAIWMSRFDGWDRPAGGITESVNFTADWGQFKRLRADADKEITGWASRLEQEDIEGELRWFSGVLKKDVEKPRELCLTHFFNHQTHHRGQLHAMLTAAGARPGDTDLYVMPEDL